MHTENLLDEDPGHKFIVSCLKGIGIMPVYFKLLHNVIEITGIGKVRLNTADFLVTHLRTEAVLLEDHDDLLQSGPYNALCTLPVGFLELL